MLCVGEALEKLSGFNITNTIVLKQSFLNEHGKHNGSKCVFIVAHTTNEQKTHKIPL
jgi:hypothetical protein